MDWFSFGTGRKPFVMLPGASIRPVTLSADAIRESCACFAEKYTVYVLDYSGALHEGCSVRSLADAAEDTLRQLGIKNAVLFGCSLGGMLAQDIASRFPASADTLVLCSTLARQNETSMETCSRWEALALAGDAAALGRAVVRDVYSPEFCECLGETFFQQQGTEVELQRFACAMRACRSFDGYEALARIRCRTLVLGAWEDRVLSGAASAEIAQKLRCALYMYAGYGHAVYDEAPDFRARVLDFLSD